MTTKRIIHTKMSGPVQHPPTPTPLQVPQYGPDWIAFALAGGTIMNGNTLMVPDEETIND